jgi:hypothetical protein
VDDKHLNNLRINVYIVDTFKMMPILLTKNYVYRADHAELLQID